MLDKSKSQKYFHLRLHTEFSISDGLVTMVPLIDNLKKMEMPAIAITDLANFFGLIKFYSKAIKAGIKPICGCDVLVENQDGVCSRLVLLVKNRTGYLNLTSLISDLYTESSNHKNIVLPQNHLEGRTEGLIALSGAQHSDVGIALLDNDKNLAESNLNRWKELFLDSFYLELQRLGKTNEELYIERVIDLAIAQQIPVVATNDVRFLSKEDFEAHEVRVCINQRRTLDDPRRSRNYTDQQYLKSSEEMCELFEDIPEAISNSAEISQRCNLELEIGVPHLPNYPVPGGVALEDYLSQLSRAGLKKRLSCFFSGSSNNENHSLAYSERLNLELKIINDMGFAGYFLIVMEFIQWAKDSDIPVGPGRGSGAGSLVAYALGITDLDPLKYDLLFERFLNPERISMPDFDVDFCMEGRDRVIQHVADLYGKDAVSQIVTFGTMAAKAVVRDVARVQGKPYALGDKISKLIPFEPGMTLAKAFEREELLVNFVKTDEDAQEIIEMAYKLEGIARNVGKHAGGVVIAPTKLIDYTPLYCEESGENLVTQFDKNDVETAGLVKFDFLGLRTLTIIDWAVKMINEQKNEDQTPVDINSLPLNDESVYRLLQQGKTTAIFQLESSGMKELIKRLLPNCFEDIIALVALFRPGPLRSGMDKEFIDRKHGRTKVEYLHPDLEPVLSDTYGVILYQEQVMQIAQTLANYTLGGADILRKAMGKKDEEEMAKQRETFMDGALSKDVDERVAKSIFDLMETFAEYGFNKSHSAAYALVAYQTAWLKTHFPSYFMAAALSADMQNTDKIVILIDECRAMGLKILPPDVDIGWFNFTVNKDDAIVYGLGAIKGVGEGPIEAIIRAREDKNFASLLDLCQRVDSQAVNKRTMEALVRSGALDHLIDGSYDESRAQLAAMLLDTMLAAEQSNRNEASGVEDLFGDIKPIEPSISVNNHGVRNFQVWTEQERLTAEKEALGLYLSGHPIDEYLPELSSIVKNRLINLKPQRGTQLVAGLLHDFRKWQSNDGRTGASLTLDDRSARFEVSLFGNDYEKYQALLQKDLILVIECTVSVDDYKGVMQGRAKQIMTLDQVRRKYARHLSLNLNSEELESGFCENLAKILAPYCNGSQKLVIPDQEDIKSLKEGCQIVINYQRSGLSGCIILGGNWVVIPTNELLQALKMEYGNDQIELGYKQQLSLN
ncbi:MAG: DNA polymerase III subunit alpha [Gammaproteobacteria bacterium]|nr:DNA polymerase III subunit alpha [Gammaproteobacteria bacterium]